MSTPIGRRHIPDEPRPSREPGGHRRQVGRLRVTTPAAGVERVYSGVPAIARRAPGRPETGGRTGTLTLESGGWEARTGIVVEATEAIFSGTRPRRPSRLSEPVGEPSWAANTAAGQGNAATGDRHALGVRILVVRTVEPRQGDDGLNPALRSRSVNPVVPTARRA